MITKLVTAWNFKMPNKFALAGVLFLTLLCISPVSAQSGDGPIYIVQSGDTLFAIASRFNITITDLMDANGINDPNLLSAGQELIIPGLQGVSGVLITEYVQYGDSLRSLSRRTQVNKSMLRKLNRLVSPTELYVGTSLIVPQEERAEALQMRITPATGESLFELAVKNNTSPWRLVQNNQLPGTWAALPGDVLYESGDSDEQATSGLPVVIDKASISPLPLKQGGTTVIRVQVPEGVLLKGILASYPLNFYPDPDGNMVALQGIHALLEPGIYPILLEATLPDGTNQSFEQMLVVISGNYPDDPLLYVNPETIDPAITEPEQEQLLSVVSQITPQKYWEGQFISPAITYAETSYFTSRYGNRRTYIGQGTELTIQSFHTGLDYAGGTGLQITAPATGKVVFQAPLTVRGNATIIDHGWGVFSGFWHQSEFRAQIGEMVSTGQVIGIVGGTGRVTGAHLHWELWVNGVQVDPLDWLYDSYP
jgi:murein DD-endopeptidase MepM/ murein hydrolase activator NlpD